MRYWIRPVPSLVCGLVVAFLPCVAQSKSELHPFPVSIDEVREHLIGDPPIVRVSLPQREAAILGMEGVSVRVTVDANGAVLSAVADKNVSADIKSRVESAAKTTQYRPFERNGRPVRATFEEQVGVLPPELVPKRHVPFPTIHDWNSIRITLSRTACFGTCPAYRVEIHGNGTVLYEGQMYVALTGTHRGSIGKETVSELVEAFRNIDYYSLQDEYVWGATDLPTYETSIAIDGKSKAVKDYAGEQVGMPLSVSTLEMEIDRLVDTERWTKGNQNTAKTLLQEKWNFKTSEAVETLAKIAESGNAEAVSDLLALGVPLDASRKAATKTLVQAGLRGDVPMLQAILDAGGAKNQDGINAALLAAASAGRLETFRLLIDAGANPIATDKSERNLLMAAAGSGVPAVVQEVLAFNPDVNARAAQGRTALMEAVGLHYGIERKEVNRAEVVRMLLEQGADTSLQDEEGNTALIECQDADAALILIRHGANVNAQNKDGVTPLINTGVPDVARVLIENGADVYLRDKDGKTALEHAKQYSMTDKAAVITAAQAGKP